MILKLFSILLKAGGHFSCLHNIHTCTYHIQYWNARLHMHVHVHTCACASVIIYNNIIIALYVP